METSCDHDSQIRSCLCTALTAFSSEEDLRATAAGGDPILEALEAQQARSDVTSSAPLNALASEHGPSRLGYRDGEPELTVFVAKSVITMEPGLPRASAIAVNGDRIVAVGDLETMQPWLAAFPHRIDETFRDDVILPGFVEPHVHPFLGALLLTFEIAAPEEWDLLDRVVPALSSPKDYRDRLDELVSAHESSDPLVVWGFLPFLHGELTLQDLDEIAGSTPLFVWHRSFHAVSTNSAGLNYLNVDEADVARYDPQHVDLPGGFFKELGIGVVLGGLGALVSGEEKLRRGLKLFTRLCQAGGVTTAVDALAGGVAGIGNEFRLAGEELDHDAVPFRTLFIAPPHIWRRKYGDRTFEVLDELSNLRHTRRLRWLPAVKALADGAFISQLMHLSPPGYIDGHSGQWMQPPDDLLEELRPYWEAGWDLHVHVNGDVGLDGVLDVLEELQRSQPVPDPRFSLHHLGISREDQIARAAALGATASTNGYYLRYFGDLWAGEGIGAERSDQMTRHGSLQRHGMRFSMHSDLPMAPISPLLAVQTAVARSTAAGFVRGPHQAVDLEQALKAVTIDAAWQYRMDHEIGSLAAGKKADFAVLNQDPFEVEPGSIGSIEVRATVFEGEVFGLR